MKNKELLKIIIVITIVLLGLVLIVKRGTKYNKLIINEDKWNDIIESRKESLDHLIDKITFNEHKLILDDESNTLYYSMIDNKSSYNPKVFTRNKVSLATKEKIDDDGIKNNHLYELLVYDDTEYEIYNIKVTRMPIISINYSNNKSKNLPIDFYLFDNYPNNTKRVITSKGYISKDEDNYSLSLTMESLGRNERENNESLLRMQNHSEYYLYHNDNYYIKNILANYIYNSILNINKDSYQLVELFINNEYLGLYTLGYKPEREYLNLDQDDFIYLKTSDTEYEFYNNEFKRIKNKDPNKDKILEEYNNILKEDDVTKIKNNINLDNAINNYLFSLLTGSLNTDTYLVFNKNNDNYVVSYYPKTYKDLFNKDFSSNINNGNPIPKLIELKDNDTINKLKDHYQDLRNKSLNLDNIIKFIDENYNSLLTNGNKVESINEFKENITKRLNSLDDYINNL